MAKRKPKSAMTSDGNVNDETQNSNEYRPLQPYDPTMLDRILRMSNRSLEVYVRNGQRRVAAASGGQR